MLKTISILALLSVAATAEAQQPPQAPPRLAPVVVEGSRLVDERTATDEQAREELQRVPGGTELITEKAIRDTRAANLKDVLDFVPGVLIRPRFGAADESQFSIRGSGLRNNFHGRGINVLIDGFPYGNADGFTDFESLELLFTRYLEIYKGANALRFGANTLGGALNYVSKTGRTADLLDLWSEAGSFGFLKNYLGSGQVYGPFDVYAGVSDTELHGFRTHSEQLRRRAFLALTYALTGGTTLRLDLGYVRNEENLPGSLTKSELRRDPTQADISNVATRAGRDYDNTRGAFTLRTPLSSNAVLEWATQLNYNDLNHPLSFGIINQTTYSWSSELRATILGSIFGLPGRFTGGVQYFATQQNDTQFNTVLGNHGARTKDQINQTARVAGYAEQQLDVLPALTAIVGGRLAYTRDKVRDRFTSNGNQSDMTDFLGFSPRFGAIYRVTPTAQIFFNASHAYEPPLMLELTAPGQVSGSNLGQLGAQKSWQFEVGTRGEWQKRVRWDISLYDIELWDEIQNINVQPFPFAPFTLPRFRNIERSRHTGVEAGADIVLARNVAPAVGLGTAGDSLTARVAYTWSRFVFIDDVNFGDNTIPGAPTNFIRAELRYDHSSGFWFAPNVEVTPNGYFVDSINRHRTTAYTLANVRLGYTYKPWNLSAHFEARNMGNETYTSSVQVDSANLRFFEPGDGRAFYGGIEWRWK